MKKSSLLKRSREFFEAKANPEVMLDKWSCEALFYTPTARGVVCHLCPNFCNLTNGETGDCKTRICKDGKLYSIAYGNPCSLQVDPIEKKPLLHFLPGSRVFSIAVAGCNLSCLNCQNCEISQTGPLSIHNYDLMPEQVVEEAQQKDCSSIAFTYSEPTVFYEYAYETAKQAHAKGIKNIFISNGYINKKPLEQLAPYLDAANIDLKAFDNGIYLRLCAGQLHPVLDTLKILKEHNVWLEITNLLIPEWTDDMDMVKRMCGWLAENGFEHTPIHFSRFHPTYKLNQLPPTPVDKLFQAQEIATQSGLNYTYIGNVRGGDFENTHCTGCHKILIRRQGYTVLENNLKENKCPYCDTILHGVWS